jgi:voltage-gated potassium channel
MNRKMVNGIIGILAILSIVIIVIESMTELSQGWLFVLYSVDLVICLIFAGEFAYRVKTAENRKKFLKTNGFEVLAMIPAFALYALGSFQAISAALRSLRLIRVIRVILVVARMRRFLGMSGQFAKQSGLIYLLIITVSIIFLGGFAALVLEHGSADPRITNFSDAI